MDVGKNFCKKDDIQEVEKIHEIPASVSVVAIAEHSYIEQQVQQAGYYEFVTKPYTVERLRKMAELHPEQV